MSIFFKKFFLILLVTCFFSACRKAEHYPPVLPVTPETALKQMPSQLFSNVFYADRQGYEWLRNYDSVQFGFVQSYEKDPRFAQALMNPSLWRQLDREFRFHSVVIAGDPAVARALIRHFLQTRDWYPAYVDAGVLIFAREGERWSESQLGIAKAGLSMLAPEAQSLGLTRIAAKLAAIDYPVLAADLLEQALHLNRNNAEALTLQGVLFADREQWETALEKANTALSSEPELQAALYLQAQSLFALKRYQEANVSVQSLMKQSPNAPNYLFLQAKIARGLSQYDKEVAALEKIIAQLESNAMSASFYYIYLGQAYSANRESKKALESFKKALEADDLTPNQREFAQKAYDRLKEALASTD